MKLLEQMMNINETEKTTLSTQSSTVQTSLETTAGLSINRKPKN